VGVLKDFKAISYVGEAFQSHQDLSGKKAKRKEVLQPNTLSQQRLTLVKSNPI